MNGNQLAFDLWCKGDTFGIRGEAPPRDWHMGAVSDYAMSLAQWDQVHAANGTGSRHVFTIYGGTASGKTECAGNLATVALNQGRVRWVVFVCPNNSILWKARQVFRERFGIHLELFKGSIRQRGIGSLSHGYITNYQTLLKNPAVHRRICGPDFLVILDEFHHLGEKSEWGASAEEAFGRVRHIIPMTGTPFRRPSDPRMPFAIYVGTENPDIARLKADVTYTLGEAVACGICRRPAFFYHDATVKIGVEGEPGHRLVTFGDTLAAGPAGEFLARERLRGAVRYGSEDRRKMLAGALTKIREANRKVIIFLGGDTTDQDRLPTEDAKDYLPQELIDLGLGITRDDMAVVPGDDKDAQAKIASFGKSDKWIFVSINMVSEGTDIPELSAAIFLTSITAKQTTIQRIGRILRTMGLDDPIKEAWAFLFRDRFLYEISDEIEAEIRSEVKKAEAKRDRAGDQGDRERRSRVMSIGVGDGRLVEVKFGGDSYTPEEFEAARRELRGLGMPTSYVPEFLQLKMRRTHGDGRN